MKNLVNTEPALFTLSRAALVFVAKKKRRVRLYRVRRRLPEAGRLVCVDYRDTIGRVEILLEASVEIALRLREDPRVVEDLPNGDPLVSYRREQAVYQSFAFGRCLTHGFLLRRRQAFVDLDHQPSSAFLRRRPLVAGTHERQTAGDHPVQHDAAVFHRISRFNTNRRQVSR